MKNTALIIAICLFVITACQENNTDTEQLKKEVWETVIAHNDAWSVEENISEQMKYVHDDIVSVFPPFIETTKGKDAYREGYLEWYEHATVHFFHEVNPDITIYNSRFAIVVYNIEMSFDYDDQLVDNWKGMDMLTLVKANGKWLITSDMYAKRTVEGI